MISERILLFIGKDKWYQFIYLAMGFALQSLVELVLVSLIPVYCLSLFQSQSHSYYQLFFIHDLKPQHLFYILISTILLRFGLQLILHHKLGKYFADLFAGKVAELNLGYLSMTYRSYKKGNTNLVLKHTISSTKEAVRGLESLFECLRNFLLIIALLTAVALFNVYALIVAGVFSFLMTISLRGIKRPQNQLSSGRENILEKIQVLLAESYRSFKELKLNENLNYYELVIHNNLAAFADKTRKLKFLKRVPVVTLESLVYLLITIGFAYWSLYSKDGIEEILPAVIFYLFVLRKLLPSFNETVQYYIEYKESLPAIEKVLYEKEVILKNREVIRYSENEINRLELKNVGFEYEPGEEILKGVDLTIAKGEKIAILGKSGAGKSTLAEVVASIQSPTSGEVLVNGKKEKDLTPFRNVIGYVPQTFYVFEGSIKENILLAHDVSDESKLMKSIQSSLVSEFLSTLPEGIDTVIGDQGNKLSGGQRQRIALARALFHEPQLLVLDEATASLDKEIEIQVLEQLIHEYPDMSIVFVTHKAETTKLFDKIVALESGEIRFIGDYANYQLELSSSRSGLKMKL